MNIQVYDIFGVILPNSFYFSVTKLFLGELRNLSDSRMLIQSYNLRALIVS